MECGSGPGPKAVVDDCLQYEPSDRVASSGRSGTYSTSTRVRNRDSICGREGTAEREFATVDRGSSPSIPGWYEDTARVAWRRRERGNCSDYGGWCGFDTPGR